MQQIYLKSLEGCRLTIGRYPTFNYDARGGGGEGVLTFHEESNRKTILFNPQDFKIPSINWKTTKLLGLPLAPGLEIEIITEKLEGYIDYDQKLISLKFEAKFKFSIFSFIKAPNLIVNTMLTNKISKYKSSNQNGKAFSDDSQIILSGISMVPPSGNILLDSFLSLPNKAEALLKCQLSGL